MREEGVYIVNCNLSKVILTDKMRLVSNYHFVPK